jgi:hypothetical protein|tara:strand:+ start:193 stop:414 length:222 start_codon:yes stop_codon:yes gene_type:complete
LKRNRATIHQQIWKRTENGLELVLPKKINSDIGFQLMFGYREDHRIEEKRIEENDERYTTKIYRDVTDFKNHI